MSKLETKIIEVLKASKRGLTRKQIENTLGLTTSADFVILSKILEELEENYSILRNKGNVYTLPKENEIIKSQIHISRAGTGYIDLDNETIIVDENDTLNAMDGDTVIVQVNKYREGKVVKVIDRAHTTYTGTFLRKGKALKCVIDDPKVRELEPSIRYDKSFTPVDGMKVVLSVLEYGRVPKLKVDKAIGHKDDPGMDILSILINNEIIPDFPEEVIQEAESISQVVSDEQMQNRIDLTKIPTITIDGDDSKDFDDAVAIEKTDFGWNLKVSIADVSYYVKEGSPLDEEAFKRGTSVYVVDRVVPMLPHLLSNGICSLNPEEVRLTMTCDMDINKDGTVRDYKIYPSYIYSMERMTYKKVNKFLDGDKELRKEYEHISSLLLDLTDCADAIRSERNRKGAIDFDSEEAEIFVNENGFPIDVHVRERGHGERVIEDCMIVSNVCVANFLQKNHIPGVYRVHAKPEARKLQSFQNIAKIMGHPLILEEGKSSQKQLQQYLWSIRDEEAYPLLSRMLLRCMQKAKYDEHCIGHYGIAEKEYLHFTSPIRRYPDLVVHRMLRKYYIDKHDEKDTSEDEAFVQSASIQSSIRERNAVDAERDVDDLKKAEYMQEKIGVSYTGMIVSITRYGFYVEIQDTIEGYVPAQTLLDDYYSYNEDAFALVGLHNHKRYTLGDKVEVIVSEVNLETRTIQFEIKGQKKTERASNTKQHKTRSRSQKYSERTGNTNKGKKNGKRRKR
ncbi:MAG: ribonuclease R [Solobacterium sp.]|nr:ribonuclease R [Solobacterium sp.]